MRAWLTCVAALAAALATIDAQVTRDRAPLVRAADALGGVARVQAVRNITLIGYGHWAYQFGGGNITASPDAPQKYQAANDLRRVYDLEHQRFQQFERRNFLFPFAAVFGHSFAPVNLVLDGDVAFDVDANGAARRVARWIEGPLHIDGVHARRMWMLTHPVTVLRAALDSGTRVSAPRREGTRMVFDLTLAQGDRLALGLEQGTSLPAFVRWSNPQHNLGQVTFTTAFTGYAPHGGLLMPLGFTTRLDWRNVEYFKLWVDGYDVDGAIADLAAPAAVRAAPEPVPALPQIRATPVAKGIWHLTGGTTVFEFSDHLTLFELGGGQPQAKAVIEFARTLVPGKPVTELVMSHAHFDHAAGFRVAVAEGLMIYARRGNDVILREMATHRAPDFPDALERNRRPLRFVPVDEHTRLGDAQMTVDLYWARGNIHMADALFAYAPAQKVLAEGDIATAARDYQFWADNYMDNIEHYRLDVEMLSPVHMQPMTQAEVVELIRGGVVRARERCAAELAKGNYFPGCPVQSKRY